MEMLYTVRWLLNGIVLSHISGLLNAVNVFLEQKSRENLKLQEVIWTDSTLIYKRN